MTKTKRKGTIDEDETFSLLRRYSATTILTLLQEVALSVDVKIDWRELVKGSSTGISNPREYQLLWRHLAYHEPLLEKVDETEPTDADSDLEFELETIPAVNSEVLLEAAACVKVLLPFKLQRPTNDSAVEAKSRVETSDRLKANTASNKKGGACPDSRKKITVSLHKQMDTRSTTELSDGNDAADSGLANKKKRKLWTEEEDSELIAAVQSHGEGNWVTILKEGFKHDRSSSQLSQRWSILKKRQAKVELHGATGKSDNQREVLNAARIALTSALHMPVSRSSSVIQTGGTQPPATSNTSTIPSTVPETSNFMQQTTTYAASPRGNLASLIQPQSTVKISRVPVKPPASTQNTIKAVALSAGGRLAGPDSAHARSLMMAAQSKDVHHFKGEVPQLISSAHRLCQRNSLMTPPALSRNTKPSSSSLRENAEKTVKETSESNVVVQGGEEKECLRLCSESKSTMSVGEKDTEKDESEKS